MLQESGVLDSDKVQGGFSFFLSPSEKLYLSSAPSPSRKCYKMTLGMLTSLAPTADDHLY